MRVRERLPSATFPFVGAVVLLGANLLPLVGADLPKTTASLYRFAVEHLGSPIFGLGDRLVDDEEFSEPPLVFELPDDDVRARLAVDARSVLLGNVWSIAFGFVNRLGLGVLAVSGLALDDGTRRGSPAVCCCVSSASRSDWSPRPASATRWRVPLSSCSGRSCCSRSARSSGPRSPGSDPLRGSTDRSRRRSSGPHR
ncbi:hypothetical protein [Salinigranum sp. GCM10025319]|uniref:hypothetical protein n=1 Tax=Salinigranum sp. GCM10025319 TaxID=3252687 RepID=UPI003609E47C